MLGTVLIFIRTLVLAFFAHTCRSSYLQAGEILNKSRFFGNQDNSNELNKVSDYHSIATSKAAFIHRCAAANHQERCPLRPTWLCGCLWYHKEVRCLLNKSQDNSWQGSVCLYGLREHRVGRHHSSQTIAPQKFKDPHVSGIPTNFTLKVGLFQ